MLELNSVRSLVAAGYARGHADPKTLRLVRALEREREEAEARIEALRCGELGMSGRAVFAKAVVLAFQVGCLLMVLWAIILGRAQ